MVCKRASSGSNGMTNNLCLRGLSRSGFLSRGGVGKQVVVKARRRMRSVKRLRL